ncbi:hypothetical protein [Candidatus Methanoliparum sp. LAM-1]|nr:hypothetical protein [Candidatus Methanoliparum sp. LAM-1]BDC36059.1 hypothetical protein MTLP_07410 [Candidatus Methanoliparum sp. LAM-1]
MDEYDKEIENLIEVIILKMIEDEGIIEEKKLIKRIKELVIDETIEEN